MTVEGQARSLELWGTLTDLVGFNFRGTEDVSSENDVLVEKQTASFRCDVLEHCTLLGVVHPTLHEGSPVPPQNRGSDSDLQLPSHFAMDT